MKLSSLFSVSVLLLAFLFLSGANCGGSGSGISLNIQQASLQGMALAVGNEDISKAILQIRDTDNKIVYETDISSILKTGKGVNPIVIDFSEIKDFDSKKFYRFISLMEGNASVVKSNFTFNGLKLNMGQKFPFKTEHLIPFFRGDEMQFDISTSYNIELAAQMSESFSANETKIDVYLNMGRFSTTKSSV